MLNYCVISCTIKLSFQKVLPWAIITGVDQKANSNIGNVNRGEVLNM